MFRPGRERRRAFLTAIVALYLGLPAAAWALAGPDRAALVGAAAAFVTGLVVLWYTWETQALRLETARQTEFNLLPYVVVRPERDRPGTERALHLAVVNLGSGPALHVRARDLGVQVAYDFRELAGRAGGEARRVPGIRRPARPEGVGAALAELRYSSWLDATFWGAPRRLVIEYENVYRTPYSLEVELDGEVARVVRPAAVGARGENPG
jgi:hypothetical protein